MNYEPFDSTLVIERLQSQAPGLREVLGAAEFSAVTAVRDYPAPCAYVVFAAETPAVDARAGLRVQTAQARFGVLLAVRNYRYQRGQQMADELRPLLGQVRGALLGWKPPVPGTEPLIWAGGQAQTYDAGVLLWAESFRCTHLLQP